MGRILSGSEIFVECLRAEGVKHLFGIPGGAILPLVDELYRARDLQYINTKHEEMAVFAADGYARSTGRPGVVLVTSGPGSTNTITGIANAYMDSVPIVVFTGQVATSLVGSDAFQETDTTGITRPITKWNVLVKNTKDLPYIIKKAFYIATTGRFGPVVVDFPKDIQVNTTEFEGYPDSISLRGYKVQLRGHPMQISKAAELINSSKRPIAYVGGGVIASGATAELLEFLEKTGMPATATLMGLTAIPADHPQFLGMLGMHGTVYANFAISESDLIVAIGPRFDDRVTGNVSKFAPHAKIIHIDIDPSSISKNIEVDVPIVGDAKHVLRELIPLVGKLDLGEWWELINKWKKEHALRYQNSEQVIKPQYVVEVVSDFVKGEAIVATDVGQHQMWVAQYFKFYKPRTLLTSGGLGSMGYGLPAAIGAQIGNPDKLVILFTSEGSIQMSIQELATIAIYELPVKIIIINNGYYGMVRQWQQLFYGSRYMAVNLWKNEKPVPDFVKLADAYGIKALRIEKPQEVPSAIKQMLEHKGPFLLDVIVDREENVFPMVPAGAGLKEIIEEMA